jgi:uncharacterized protein
MKHTFFVICFISASNLVFAQPQYHEYPITAADIKHVVLTDNFWLPKIRTIQGTTIRYAFDKCAKEGRMENFLIAGGKKKGPVRGKMPFDDTDLYKILEGASYSLVSSPNPTLDAYCDSIIAIIKIGQEPDGYLTTWFTIDRQHPPASWVKPSSSRWENEISSHELYNSGHLFEAAAAHYFATGKRNLLDIALKNADLLAANFGPGKLHRPPGHQIVETGLIKLYEITNDTKYLELAKYFLDLRGDSTTHPLYGEYNQDHLPVTRQQEAVGHAVRAEYMYAGMTDIAAIYRDSSYLNAVTALWENIVDKKLYITGGVGARHEGEAFGKNYELPNLTAYNETCASIGSVYWNQRLFLLTGDAKYYDVLERTLYNGLISGISLDGNKFFYPNPLESDGAYAFNMGSATRQSWFDCSCCPTNLIRFIPSIPGLVYASRLDTLYINLYMSNTALISVDGKILEVQQHTDYPLDGRITFVLNPQAAMPLTLKLRIPGWARNTPVPGTLYEYIGRDTEKVSVKINGEAEPVAMNNGYVELSRSWKRGDSIELVLTMQIRRVVTDEHVTENRNRAAVEYGPIVYCAEQVDNPSDVSKMFIADSAPLRVERESLLSNPVNMITGTEAAAPSTPVGNRIGNEKVRLIPYYLWSNRGVGKMKVWFPRISE